MRKITLMALACLILAGLGAAQSGAVQSLVILTENDPPLQFLGPDGKLAGFSIEIVREIQSRVGNNDPIEMIPWSRAYDMILTEPNVVLFSMTRTGERNPLFSWVGPVLEITYGFYARADSRTSVSSLDEAKKVGRIGVYKDDVRDKMLSSLGFSNLDRASDNITNVRKLMTGRIDLYASSDANYAGEAMAAGYRPEDLRLVYVFSRMQLYVAMSRAMPPSVVSAWNDALEAMKKDGVFERIFRKYFPDGTLPGPPITKF